MIDNRSEVAVYFLCRLAVLDEGEVLRLSTVSNETGFSLSYLEAISKQLKTAGLIKSTQGPKGGYSLAKYEGDIYLADVFNNISLFAHNRLSGEISSVILNNITKGMIGKLTLFSVVCRLPLGWKNENKIK